MVTVIVVCVYLDSITLISTCEYSLHHCASEGGDVWVVMVFIEARQIHCGSSVRRCGRISLRMQGLCLVMGNVPPVSFACVSVYVVRK